MQRTRFNTLVEVTVNQAEQLFTNPWRKISLSLISWLFGFFMGSAIVTTAGQDAEWDVVAAAMLFIVTELISKFVYGRDRNSKSQAGQNQSIWLSVLNIFKVGLTYSLFLEAFKLGS